MLKRFIAVTAVFLVFAVTFVAPVSASELEETLVYDLAFSESGITDLAGTANVLDVRMGEVPAFYDEDVKMNYGEFGPDTQLAIKGADLQQFTEMTIEMYVKITSEKDIDFLNVTNSGVELVALKESACFGLGNGGTITAELFARNE